MPRVHRSWRARLRPPPRWQVSLPRLLRTPLSANSVASTVGPRLHGDDVVGHGGDFLPACCSILRVLRTGVASVYASPRIVADVVEPVDTRDLKSLGRVLCGFESRRPHHQHGTMHRWACSSIGQSRRLITVWLQVRVLPGPPTCKACIKS